jgi:hypothetical protein
MGKYDKYIDKWAAVVDKGTFGPTIYIGPIVDIDEEMSDAGGDDVIHGNIVSMSYNSRMGQWEDDGKNFVDLFLVEIADNEELAQRVIFRSLFNMFWPGEK